MMFKGSRIKKAQKMIFAGRNDEAHTILEDITKSSPDNMDAVLWLAIAKHNLKDYEGALASIDKLTPKDFKKSVCLMVKGEILHSMEKYKESLALLTQAIELNPDNTRISYLLGLNYLKLGDIDQASNFFETAIRYDRELVDSRLLAMAELYLHKNK
jgi:tetratricopeptide (TPR) repeat protein